ncbi:MAG: hypothetical protein U1G08_05070 [Verrucomicrobiota bacterium]
MAAPVQSALRFLCAVWVTAGSLRGDPIRRHPENPHWFDFNGRATALITSGEHYGAVINPDFDFRTYLESLQRDGMNYTRVFAGTYVEPAGAFGITRNTLAPGPGRFLSPWARSDAPGYAGGGNRFDLHHLSEEYLTRRKTFLGVASRRGIVVELTLFCSTYGTEQWAVHPLNPSNNVQSIPVADWRRLHTLTESPEPATPVFQVQEAVTRWLVRELNYFDNLIYEIQNEPWADNSSLGERINPYLTDRAGFPNAVEVTSARSVAWQRALARVIVDEERRLPKRHLIAQNVANFRLALRESDLVPEAGLVQFHYAFPEAVSWNRGAGVVLGFDETGFAGAEAAPYRRQAWNFLLEGGGLFNNLDYSFTPGHEDGSDTGNRAPGSGGAELRRELRVLADFLGSFDLAGLRPDTQFVLASPGVVSRVLSDPGHAHAMYLEGRGPTAITVNLEKGMWKVDWISTHDGRVLGQGEIRRKEGGTVLESPPFEESIAVRLSRP